MYHYKFVMKSGVVTTAENEWLSLSTLHGLLNERNPFIQVGDKVFAKDAISHIEKIEEMKLETTEE